MLEQLHSYRERKYNRPLKGIFYLYGTANVGKTTILARLAILLSVHKRDFASRRKIYKQYADYRDKKKPSSPIKKGAFPDIRIIVKYGKKRSKNFIYIATPGDGINLTEQNVLFFQGLFHYEEVLLFDGSSLRSLNKGEANYFHIYPPKVCISSCRTTGLVEKPLDYFAETKHIYVNLTEWIRIRKEKWRKNQMKNKRFFASYLKERIDIALKMK